MSALNRSTRRRLQQLPQIPSVWEGDRRPFGVNLAEAHDSDIAASGEYILWVDGSEGVIRSMDVVTPETGYEPVVRTLLRAMEHPQSPAMPARPQKIIVCDRQLQFFLRGVLQDLDITIDYVPDLPVIDALVRGFEQFASNRPPQIPPQYAELVMEKVDEAWFYAPWRTLADHQIIAIEINQWDVGTLYVSVMGMLGMEYGILLYRSLDSLQRFRASVLQQDTDNLEAAFLGQDCLFITFEQIDEDDDDFDFDDDDDHGLAPLSSPGIEPHFGSVHPLEGMRPFIYEEEALIIYVALDALNRFLKNTRKQLNSETLPKISKRYRVTIPTGEDAEKPIENISVKVQTLPEVSAELLEMAGIEEDEDTDFDLAEISLPLQDDLVPKNSFFSLGVVAWERLDLLKNEVDYYQPQPVKPAGEGLPVILIQTTRPKAKTIIKTIQNAGGLKGIGFNPGEDPMIGESYDLGILQTEDGTLYLCGEFVEDDPVHINARKKWEQRCKKTKGYCGLIIAKGLTGAARANPQLNDMMALFVARSLSSQDLGLGLLELIPEEFD